MALKKAIEPQQPASFRLIAEPPVTHQGNVVPHQFPKHAAEGRKLAQRFERPTGFWRN